MKKALCVGISYYENASHLHGAANNAKSIAKTLATHYNDVPNFEVTLKTASNPDDAITRSSLIQAVEELFSGFPEVALFYYAGYGIQSMYDLYLCTSDARYPEDGLSLETLMKIVSCSRAECKIIFLEYWSVGNSAARCIPEVFYLPHNTTILAYGCQIQPTDENQLTSLIYEALNDSSMNFFGQVNLSNIYEYVEQTFCHSIEKPLYQTNNTENLLLRINKPIHRHYEFE